VVRAQQADEPVRSAPPKLTMPSPEALGVPVPRPATELDWTALRVRLDRLGATQFTLTKLPEGGYCFTCRLPSAGTVEGRATTEAEAVQRALEQAEAGR
jgi:hypothetical protein